MRGCTLHMLGPMTTDVATRAEDRPPISAEWLAAAKAARGTSWAVLARRLEVDESTVYRWRTGDSPITRVIWLSVLHALDLPASWKPNDPVPPLDA